MKTKVVQHVPRINISILHMTCDMRNVTCDIITSESEKEFLCQARLEPGHSRVARCHRPISTDVPLFHSRKFFFVVTPGGIEPRTLRILTKSVVPCALPTTPHGNGYFCIGIWRGREISRGSTQPLLNDFFRDKSFHRMRYISTKLVVCPGHAY